MKFDIKLIRPRQAQIVWHPLLDVAVSCVGSAPPCGLFRFKGPPSPRWRAKAGEETHQRGARRWLTASGEGCLMVSGGPVHLRRCLAWSASPAAWGDCPRRCSAYTARRASTILSRAARTAGMSPPSSPIAVPKPRESSTMPGVRLKLKASSEKV